MTSHQTALSDTRLGGRGHYNIFVQCAISPDHLCASLWPERTKAPDEIRLGSLVARHALVGVTVPTAR